MGYSRKIKHSERGRLVLFSLLLLLTTPMIGQTLERDLVSSSSNQETSSISWSIGEVVISSTQTHQGFLFPESLDCIDNAQLSLGNDTTLCSNTSLLLDTRVANASYLWSDNSALPTLTVNEAGTYWVTVTTCSQILQDTIEVMFVDWPPYNATNDLTFCPGESLELDVSTDGATYIWQDGTIQPVYEIVAEGNYQVDVMVDNCINSFSFDVRLDNCGLTLNLPNVFTPNDDELNDYFVPIESKGILSMTTKIFDRSGTLVYSTDNIDIFWDGRFENGNLAPSGIYYYIAYFSNQFESRELKGYLTLLK